MHVCGVMTRWTYTHTRKYYKITKEHQSMLMYGVKWKALTSWSRFSTREHCHAPNRRDTNFMFCHRGVIYLKTISHIFTSLVECNVMTHQPLYIIMHFTLTMVTWHDDSSRRNLFLEDYPISAFLFVFPGSNTKLFLAIYLLYFRDMLWHDRNTPTHLTSDMRPLNDITSHSGSARLTQLHINSINFTSWHALYEW